MISKANIWTTILLLLFSQLAFAQKNHVDFEQLNLANGLSHSLVSGCAEDRSGFMWFTTQDGLNRYDGYGFKVYQTSKGHRSPTISWMSGIYIDRFDQMWVKFEVPGLNRFDIKTEMFYNYLPNPDKPGSISNVQFSGRGPFSNNIFYEDPSNRLWIGTQNGLNLYNRKEDNFTTYYNEPENNNSLSDNRIIALTGDSKGNLWIGTRNGLNVMNPETGKTIRFSKNLSSNSLSDSVASTIFVENDSTIWVGTNYGGLNLIENPDNPSKLKITKFLGHSVIKNEEASVNSIYKTGTGRILVGMIGGLYEIKKTQDGWQTIPFEKTLYFGIEAIREDFAGNIWVSASRSKNLYRFNKEMTVCDEIPLISKTFGESKNIKTQFLYTSTTGILWVGTEKDGILKADLNAKNFELIDNSKFSTPHVSNKEIYSIYQNDAGDLFIGTKEGLNIIRKDTKAIEVFKHSSENPKNITFNASNEIPGNIIGVLKPMKNGKIWIGFFDYKVSLFDPVSNSFLNFHHNPADPNAFRTWSLRTICVTRSDDVYFGGTTDGLVHYNPREKNFDYFPVTDLKDGGTNDSWLNIIYEDSEGIIWIGTSQGGLNRFDPKNGAFKHYTNNPYNHSSISNNLVKCILEPKNDRGILWLGTHGGVIKFNKSTEKFETIDKSSGLLSNSIHGILEDNEGNLWISSNKGLSCLDPKTLKIRNYNSEDGLQSDEFNEGAYYKSKSGIMYFGGVNGITRFDPASLKENPYDARPVITNFSIFNNPVLPLDTIENRVILKENISTQQEIVLNYKDRIFSFEFSSLHYVSAHKTQFKYILEGFETVPNIVDASKRFASYTNIPTGDYEFKVWATNSDGKWSPVPASLRISILPPFWQKNWFKGMLVIAILLLFFSIVSIRTSILKKQKEYLKVQVEKQTHDLKMANQELEFHQTEIIKQNEKIAAQRDNLKEQNFALEQQKGEIETMAKKLHQADELKLRFFTNISHEFRTPLTLILGPTESLLDKENYSDTKKVKETLSLIHKNEKRLFRLINQLLEIRRVETGSLKLKVREEDIIPFLLSITELFEGLARKNNINLSFISESESLKFFYDADKIEKIVFNLLSNSFNHTPPGGAITVFLEQTESEKKTWVKISVIDSGKGISEKHLPHIFDRFYQLSTKSETGQISSGIGLSLCKDMIEKHKGKISASSLPDKGTTMEVMVPLCTDCYEKDEFSDEINESVSSLNFSKSMLDSNIPQGSNPSFINQTATIDSFRILIIEDDADMRKYLADELSSEYHLNTAPNGEEGLKMVQVQIPDLIISDLMMPVMDGYELCKHVKSNELTSHIPVILLTAKTSEESQIQGLEFGADDYITKPFNPNILKLRIRNILENRTQLATHFSSELETIPANIKISEIDHGFLEKIVKIIEDNIDDSELSGDRLAAELGVSKGNLYKKLKALSGLTVNIFIRNIRLKIAARLLKKGNYNISEVAYAVGFNNPKYFSTCFSELFNMSPKEYMQG